MNKTAYILLLLFIANTVFGISPKYSIKTKGNVTDLIFESNKLYVSTDNGSICVFSIPSKKLLKTYSFANIKDFAGDNIAPKVYDIDKITGKNIIVSVSQGMRGFSNVFITKDGVSVKIITDIKSKLMIKKVKFIGENKVLLGLLSNEIVLYDIINKKEIYRKQISAYTFSDIVLNKAKTKIITADESGIIHLIDAKTGNSIKELSGNNVDNVYQIDFKGNIIVCGGQDRRFSVYNISTHKSYYLSSSFLIYSVGLSPTGKYAGYYCNEDNDVKVINTASKSEVAILNGHDATLTKILFISDTKIFTGAEENVVYYWEF